MIEKHSNEITLFYNSRNEYDKRTIAYAKSNFQFVREYDIANQDITGTTLEEISSLLQKPLKDLVKDAPQLGSDMDYIKYIQHNPDHFMTPIAVSKKGAVLVRSYGDFTKILP
ncbi:MAG: hypothetical protein OHK0038_19800 [Flammeovirgaceae bacterium]